MNLIKKLWFFYIFKVIFYKIFSFKYKFIFNSFGKWSYIYGSIDLFKRWYLSIWSNCIIESSRNKSHFWCDIEWNINIWDNVFINQWLIIDSWKNSINIWNNVKIWPNVTIMSVDNHWSEYWVFKENQDVSIWYNTWIGSNSIILPGVNIWKNTIIGAGSIVTKDQPSNSICWWNPCKFIKNII